MGASRENGPVGPRRTRPGYARITTRNQVTIPAAILDELGLKRGDELRVEVIDGAIFLRREDLVTRRRRALEELSGSMTGMYGPDYLKKLRSEWG